MWKAHTSSTPKVIKNNSSISLRFFYTDFIKKKSILSSICKLRTGRLWGFLWNKYYLPLSLFSPQGLTCYWHESAELICSLYPHHLDSAEGTLQFEEHTHPHLIPGSLLWFAMCFHNLFDSQCSQIPIFLTPISEKSPSVNMRWCCAIILLPWNFCL